MGGWQYLKKANQRRAVGKRLAPLDKKLQKVEWGEYRFDKIFTPLAVKNKLTKDNLDTDGKVPVYSSESTNNGIIGYTSNDADFIVDSNNPAYVVFGDHTRTFSIASESFCVADNVKVLAVKNKLSIRVLLCIVSSWQRCIPNKGYSRHWSVAQKVLSKLPTKNGEIDFAFMESFIAELEAERIAELEAYLVASGLKDYALTKEEKKALAEFENEKIEWGEFKIGDLFEINPTKYYRLSNEQILSEIGKVPLVSNSSTDNGVMGFSELEPNNDGSTITCSDTTLGAETMYYQKNDFIGYSHIQHLVPKFRKFNWFIAGFIISASKIATAKKYNYGQKFNREAMNGTEIKLFTKNNQPDYDKMETFISAIQKLVIKDVVLYCKSKKK